MRSAKAVAIANMAETNSSPSRIPLSLKVYCLLDISIP